MSRTNTGAACRRSGSRSRVGRVSVSRKNPAAFFAPPTPPMVRVNCSSPARRRASGRRCLRCPRRMSRRALAACFVEIIDAAAPVSSSQLPADLAFWPSVTAMFSMNGFCASVGGVAPAGSVRVNGRTTRRRSTTCRSVFGIFAASFVGSKMPCASCRRTCRRAWGRSRRRGPSHRPACRRRRARR